MAPLDLFLGKDLGQTNDFYSRSPCTHKDFYHLISHLSLPAELVYLAILYEEAILSLTISLISFSKICVIRVLFSVMQMIKEQNIC